MQRSIVHAVLLATLLPAACSQDPLHGGRSLSPTNTFSPSTDARLDSELPAIEPGATIDASQEDISDRDQIFDTALPVIDAGRVITTDPSSGEMYLLEVSDWICTTADLCGVAQQDRQICLFGTMKKILALGPIVGVSFELLNQCQQLVDIPPRVVLQPGGTACASFDASKIPDVCQQAFLRQR